MAHIRTLQSRSTSTTPGASFVRRTVISIILLGAALLLPALSTAQQTSDDDQPTAPPSSIEQTLQAEVIETEPIRTETLPGLGTTQEVQTLQARIISDVRTDQVVSVENDLTPLRVGDTFFLEQRIEDGQTRYTVAEIDRLGAVYVAVALFVGVIVLFGGWQGVRSLVSLLLGIAAVVFVLLPLLFAGFAPVLVSICVAAIVLAVAIFVSHGFTRNSAIAYGGTLVSVLIAGLLSLAAIWALHLTGYGVDEATFVSVASAGAVDVQGLLLAGILIGMIGVLDDISITQVAVVSELRRSSQDRSRRDIVTRAMRVGREHVGALVNTLVLAYVGASLPLLLLLYNSPAPLSLTLSQEVFVTEIVRAIIGSIGLVLAVPLTTFAAGYFGTNDTHDLHTHPH